MAGEDGDGELGDNFIRRIVQFEEGVDGSGPQWLGGRKGVVVGILLLVGAGVAMALGAVASFALSSELGQSVSKLFFLLVLVVLAAAAAYWRRQRMAAHFESARRLVESADPGERQRGFTEMIVNARRGRAEHRRIAGTLTAYLRRPPQDQPGEDARRQIALSVLTDYTLSPEAKEKLDLTGASLVGLRAVNAELAGVCLRGANLSNAKFVRANLANADLEGARIEGADFTGATLDGTILASRPRAS